MFGARCSDRSPNTEPGVTPRARGASYPQNTFEPLALSLGPLVGAFSCTGRLARAFSARALTLAFQGQSAWRFPAPTPGPSPEVRGGAGGGGRSETNFSPDNLKLTSMGTTPRLIHAGVLSAGPAVRPASRTASWGHPDRNRPRDRRRCRADGP